jgi:phage terminase small subunit
VITAKPPSNAGSQPAPEASEAFDPRPVLELVAQGLVVVSPQQLRALTALLPYVHGKKGEGGKKEQKQAQAEKVANRFAPAAPPRLIAAGGKKV